MLSSSLLANALTPDEQQLVPESVLSKLQDEIGAYEEMVGVRARELERKVWGCEELIGELNRKVVKQEMEMKEMKSAAEEMERYNEMCSQEISSLRGEVARYKESGGDARRGEPAMGESESMLEKRCAELESSNRRLAEKVLEQKGLMGQLVKRISGSDGGRDSLELVKLVQRLSRRNEELEKMIGSKKRGSECGSMSAEGDEGERSEYKRMRDELYEVKRNGYVLELEYNKVFKERGELYGQLGRITEEKKMMQKRIDEMREEVMCLKIELSNTKMKNTILGDASQKLGEMNNEIVRSNLLIREGRNKIRELKAQLAESEERYNKYILEDRTGVVAVIGREIEGIKRKMSADSRAIYDIEESFRKAVGEQERLRRLFVGYEQEVVDLRGRCEALANEERVLGERVRRGEMREAGLRNGLGALRREIWDVGILAGEAVRDVMELVSIANGVVVSEGERRRCIAMMYEELDAARRAAEEKDQVVQSVMEGRDEDAIAFLGKERGVLMQENIFLRNKIESLGDSSDLLERISSLEEENEAVKAKFALLEKAYVSEKHLTSGLAAALRETDNRCRLLQSDLDQMLQKSVLLQSELEGVRKEVADGHATIGKYRIVVEKLKKIKDAYLKIKGDGARKESRGKEEEAGQRGVDVPNANAMEPAGMSVDADASSVTPKALAREENVDDGVRGLETERDTGTEVESVADQGPASGEKDGGKGQPGKSKRGGRYGEDSRQGHQGRRGYGDRKRGWPSSYEFKRSKDRRN